MAAHSPIDCLDVIRHGLPANTGRRQRVVVVGAGMAGLVAAYELVRAGHDVEILEAQGRIGGRVLTLREPFAPGLHAEAGAMRIPRSHDLTLAYIEKFALPTFPFTMGNPMAYYVFQGQKVRAGGRVPPGPAGLPSCRHRARQQCQCDVGRRAAADPGTAARRG